MVGRRSKLLFTFQAVMFQLVPVGLMFDESHLVVEEATFVRQVLSLLLIGESVSITKVEVLISEGPVTHVVSILYIIIGPIYNLSFTGVVGQ